MASGVFNMLAALAGDQKILADFRSNPESIMDEFNLTEEQKELIKNSLNEHRHHDFFKVLGDEIHEQFADPDILFC